MQFFQPRCYIKIDNLILYSELYAEQIPQQQENKFQPGFKFGALLAAKVFGGLKQTQPVAAPHKQLDKFQRLLPLLAVLGEIYAEGAAYAAAREPCKQPVVCRRPGIIVHQI